MIVRAKVKPLSTFPDSAICCPEFRKRHAEVEGEVLKIDLGTVFTASQICPYCDHDHGPSRIGRLADRPEYVIALNMFDLDEGAAA